MRLPFWFIVLCLAVVPACAQTPALQPGHPVQAAVPVSVSASEPQAAEDLPPRVAAAPAPSPVMDFTEDVLDDASGVAADRARMRWSPCHAQVARGLEKDPVGYKVFLYKPEGAFEVLYQQLYRHCHHLRLRRLLDNEQGLTYEWLRRALMKNSLEMERARAEKYILCQLPSYTSDEPAAKYPLTGDCALPHAWRARGLSRKELCLDTEMYSFLLALWTFVGGNSKADHVFAEIVRQGSRETFTKSLGTESTLEGQCEPPT